MNYLSLKQKFTHKCTVILTFLVLQITVVNNVYAIKLYLNGEPSQASGVVLNLSEDFVYNYSEVFNPIVTNTDSPYLCLGPNFGLGTDPNVSFDVSSNDPLRVYGLVGIASSVYDYSPPDLIDKTLSLTTMLDSQCVVKGYVKTNNPSPGNPFIFADDFEDGGSGIPLVNPDLDISLLDESGAPLMIPVLSDSNDFTFMYKIENIGDTPITLDVVDYFSQTNNSTVWSCVKSMVSDVATNCGTNAQNPDFNMGTTDTYNQAVYLKDAHIEAPGDALIITVTRNPIIASDGISIDLLATALVTGQNDNYKLNNSDTRVLVGNTNAAPTFTSTVSNQTILEDALTGTGDLAFTVDDVETSPANLIVTATSSDQNIVANANITIGGSGMNRTVSIVSNDEANTSTGPVTITLRVADDNGGVQTSNFNLNITPVNDKPTFTVPTVADYPAATSGSQLIPNFIQNIVYGPTVDEDTQTIIMKSISVVSDPNGVFSSPPLLSTDLFLSLSGQGGTVMLNVQIQDDGDTLNGGQDTSDIVPFSITVLNTLPVISMVSNSVIDEDNSTSAIAFNVSDVETSAGSLMMSAMSSDTSIVPVSGIQFPAFTGGSRTVQITPAMNQNTDGLSPVTITLIVSDGSDTSQTTFELTINPINDAPTFSLGANINNVVADAGFQTILNYATALSMGPTGDEDLNQNVLNYNVTITDASGIFDQSTVPVDINNNGTLNYVLTGNTGTATILVSLQDDGTTANGGVDTSATQSFTITVQ